MNTYQLMVGICAAVIVFALYLGYKENSLTFRQLALAILATVCISAIWIYLIIVYESRKTPLTKLTVPELPEATGLPIIGYLSTYTADGLPLSIYEMPHGWLVWLQTGKTIATGGLTFVPKPTSENKNES